MPNVIAVFENPSKAQQAIERMINDGVDRDQISLISRESDQDKTRDASTERSSGAGIGGGLGATGGGLIGALTAMGVPEEEARQYQDQVRQGSVLVALRADNDAEADRASNIMQLQGAVDVEGGGEEGNVEAAPEYEGARSRDPDDLAEQRAAEARAEITRDPNFAASESAPAGRKMPGYDERTSEGGRVRVYGRTKKT